MAGGNGPGEDVHQEEGFCLGWLLLQIPCPLKKIKSSPFHDLHMWKSTFLNGTFSIPSLQAVEELFLMTVVY